MNPSKSATISITAAQLADKKTGLAISRQAVHQHLSGIPAKPILTDGRPVNGWPFHALPPSTQERLADLARKRGFPDAETMLAGPGKIDAPKVRFQDYPESFQQRAVKLCAA